MKVLDRINIIDKIGRKLQSQMSYGEIDIYLKAYGVDTKRQVSNVSSKWVYVKELLADARDDLIIKIADELEIPHGYALAGISTPIEASCWKPFYFRLFISHLSSFKNNTGKLRDALFSYGISAFVAHSDIEPTKEWLREIEASLLSMDALAAILMPGFKESGWTDQEVGVAIGRGILVVPIMKGCEPYGFISKYQGLNADGKKVGEVADEIFRILIRSEKTRSRMLSCLIDAALHASSENEAKKKIELVASIANIPGSYLEKLRSGAGSTPHFMSGEAKDALNELLASRKLDPIASERPYEDFRDDNIPF